MSDDIREDAAGDTPAVETATATEPAKEPAGTLAGTGVKDAPPQEKTDAAEPAKPAADAPKASWPEDWRDQLAGGDEKLKQMLARYSSPANVAKAFKDQRDALAKRVEPVAELPKDATPEQIAEYRKAKGVPEKPEDYEFEVPEGKELSDGEYEILMDFAKSMHGANIPKDMVKAASNWFLNYEAVVAQKAAEAAYKNRVEVEEKLRAEWGADFKPNVNLVANIMQEHLGSKTADFLGMQLKDGSKLGDNETFLRLMTDLARKVGGSTADLYSTDVQTTAVALEDRKQALLKMKNSADPLERKKYLSPAIQDELQRIYAAQVRRAG